MRQLLRNLALVALMCVPWVTQGQQSLPYSQDFSGSSLPDGWVSVGSGSLTISSNTLKFSGAASNVVALPEFAITNGNYLTVTFEVKAEGNYSSCNYFDWGYITDISDASTFEPLGTVYYSSVQSFTQKTMELMSVPAGARAALRARPTSGSYYWFVDNVEVTESPLPTCFKPTLADNPFSNITATGATITWTPDTRTTEPSGGWEIRYRVSGSDGDYTTANAASDATSKTLTDLTASTSYEVSVRAHCEGDDYSDWTAAKTFKTLCNPSSTFPYEENFDSYTGSTSGSTNNLPACWNYINTTTYSYYIGYPIVYNSSSNAYSPNNYLYFFSYYSWSSDYDPQDQYAILPPMENLAGKQIVLQAKGYNASSTFKIGTMTDPSDVSTFSVIATQALTTSYQEFTYNIPSNTTAQHVAIMIEAATSSRTTNGVYIDDISISEPPSCMKVTDVAVALNSATSATISWTDGNSGTPTYTVKMGETELSGSTTPAVSFNGATATLTGLTADHQYAAGDFTVIANCGGSDHSEAANVPAFYTGYCQPAGSNIDGKGITGVVFGSGDGTTVSNINANGLTNTSPYYGNFSSMIGAVAAGTAANVDITLGTGYTYVTVIWVDWNNNLTFEDAEIVYAGEAAATNPITFTASFDIDANQALGDYRMRIASADSYYDSHKTLATAAGADPCPTTGYVQIQDYTLRVTEAPSCMPVNNLTAPEANITSSSIALTWTDNNNGSATYIITDGEDNAIPAAQIENLTATGVTITGLTANTAYSFKVKADCGGGEYSDPVSINNVKTACGTETIPFTENFDSYAASSYSTGISLPDCWSVVPVPTSYSSNTTVIYNTSAHSGSNHLRSYYATNNKIILPEMDAATNTLQVRFWHRQSSSGNYGSLQVGYLTDIEDTSTFVAVQSFSNIGTTYIESEVTLENAPDDARIAFRHLGSGSYNYIWYIDDITVEPIPACKNVTAVTVPSANVTSNSATLSWTDTRNTGATYTIYNKATEPATILGTTTEAGVTTINLTGLTAHTTYNQLVVVANCSENEHSGEVSVPSFTTKRNECAITAVSVTAPAGVTRGDVVINAENHSVTIPVYYMSAAEIAALTGNITKSTSATIYAYNATTSDWTTTVSYLASIRDNLAMNTPYTVRVVAEDPAVYQDWTITLQGEDCSTPRNLTFTNVERRAFTANWVNADPAAEDYQVVISPSRLDDAALDAAEKTAVDGAKTYTFTGLLRETKYHVYVRTACGNDTYSSWLNDSVTTKGLTFCEDVDVANGTKTNGYLPIYGNWADANQRSQSIYPASELTELQGKTISALKYYTNRTYTTAPDWVDGTWVVGLAITEQADLSSAWDETIITEVHNGTITWDGDDKSVTVTFTTPFTYTGGNLLVAFDYPDYEDLDVNVSFYGKEVTGASRYAYNTYYTGAGTVQNFLPKFSATYCETNEACPAVAEIEVSDITETGATVTWTASAGDYVSSYQVIKSAVELDADALEAYAGPYAYDGTDLTCELTGLTAYIDYYVYVRANCGAPDNVNSTWQSATFRTLSACGAVADLAVEQTGKTTVVATWSKTKEEQDNNFNYILSTDDEYDVETQGDDLNVLTPTGSGITNLTVTLNVNPGTHYYLYVQNYCEGEGASPWKSVDFTTYDAMPAVVGLTATEITHTAIAATWQKNEAQFADETQWQVAAVLHGETPAAWTVVSDTHYTFVG